MSTFEKSAVDLAVLQARIEQLESVARGAAGQIDAIEEQLASALNGASATLLGEGVPDEVLAAFAPEFLRARAALRRMKKSLLVGAPAESADASPAMLDALLARAKGLRLRAAELEQQASNGEASRDANDDASNILQFPGRFRVAAGRVGTWHDRKFDPQPRALSPGQLVEAHGFEPKPPSGGAA